MEEAIVNFIVSFATKYPWVLTVLLVIGTLRAFFKPLQLAIDQAVADTESTKDNEVWEKIKANWAYKAFVWVVDLLGSIKLPK